MNKVLTGQLHATVDAAGFPAKLTITAGVDVVSMWKPNDTEVMITTKNGVTYSIPYVSFKFLKYPEAALAVKK